jgi:hypothetical protein
MQRRRYIYELSSSGVEGFVANERWLRQQVRTGRICSKCNWLRLDRVGEIQAVCVFGGDPPPIHVGLVSGVGAGVLFSNRLLRLLGGSNARYHALPVTDFMGHRYDFTYLIEKQQTGCARGSFRLPPWICPVCDRLSYFPRGEKYMLDLYWPPQTRFKVDGFGAFVDAEIFERKIKPKRLSRLTSKKVKLVAQVSDGYPADFDAMFQKILDEDA